MLKLSRLTLGNPNHPPLIFLHGFLGVKEDWQEMFFYFQDRFFCIAFDLPGHGESPYSEEILITIQNELKTLEKPICIGYSMGGRIALKLQDTAKAVIAISAHPGLTNEEEKDLRRQTDMQWKQKLLNLPFPTFLAEWYSQPIFESLHRTPERLSNILKMRVRQNPQNLVRVLHQMSLADQKPVADFSCPTFFLYGEEDLKYRELYYRLPKTVAIESINNCGHAIHLENPADCAKKIIHWIEVLNANS
jgi:2-succinyl-6-hydroxy-2,4-cyclohexadiene-1-carboxylate synthase